jgi:tRNA G18 (ribose-2'-O)-methylase SpoU
VGHQIHQGIMGEFLAPPETPYQQMQGDIIVVDGLKHVENIGSIIRSGVELKMKNFVFLNGSCHPLIRRAVRVSMGACFSINYQVIEDQAAIGAFISHFHAKKYQFVAIEKGNEAVPSLPSVPTHQIDCRNTPLCLILGSEVGGIGQELLTFHNQVLPFLNSFAYLPASAEGNYLNVAIASALVFYEVWRQRFHFS